MNPDEMEIVEEEFVPRSYRIYWTAADPGYNITYRLVPIIVLYESELGHHDDMWKAYLQFYPADKVEPTTVKGKIMYLNYSIHAAEATLALLESDLVSVEKVETILQDGRRSGRLVSPIKKIN